MRPAGEEGEGRKQTCFLTLALVRRGRTSLPLSVSKKQPCGLTSASSQQKLLADRDCEGWGTVSHLGHAQPP